MKFLALFAGILGLGVAAPSERANSNLPPLTYNETSFFYNGEPIQLLAGQMDAQRIPHELWRDRLKMAKAMGLNTILTYPFWDLIEPEEGKWDFSGENNIAEYFKIAQEEGLMTSLRLGPYVCAEHTWGGYPAWLINKDGTIRTGEGELMDYYKKYMEKMYEHVKDQLASNGGSIVMVQIENEYGAYANDSSYKEALRDLAIEVGYDVLLYTTDQANDASVKGGNIPNTLQELDGADADVSEAQKYIPVDSSKGPFMNTEYYTHWYDQFNATYQHEAIDDKGIEKVRTELTALLKKHGSFSLYMFHGGTNFGFQAGANWDDDLQTYLPTTSAYDYSAPLDESGRTTKLYDTIREVLVDHWKTVNSSYKVPDVPDQTARIETDKIQLKACKRVLDNLPSPAHTDRPTNMEAIGQANGFINFRKTIDSDIQGDLSVGDRPRDRILVYVNNKRQGLIDARFHNNPTITLDLKKDDQLDLFVENLGRVNYGHNMEDQRKGIVGDVSINNHTLSSGWKVYGLPFDEITPFTENCDSDMDSSNFSPTVYTGQFHLDTVDDTFLSTDGWAKGVAWVNGHNLGKYWTIGPQQQLYVPKSWLKKGQNTIALLELVSTNSSYVQGVQTRSWYNNPDPDAP